MRSNDIDFAWNAVAPILEKFKFDDIKTIVGLAGFDRSLIEHFTQNVWNGENNITNLQLISKIGCNFFKFTSEKKQHFLNIVIEEILSDRYSSYSNDILEERLQYCLNRLGWQVIDYKALPIEILDSSDLNELDSSVRNDLIKAATKFRDGDLSGAISSACAAVDSLTAKVYQAKNLGDHKNTSFQERCNKSLKQVGVFEALDKQLSEIAWKEGNISQFKNNLQQSLNQAAFVMQSLRSEMSDAHGTKPVIKPLVFDSIKWAQIIIRFLSEEYEE
jgi:hypothetical protein